MSRPFSKFETIGAVSLLFLQGICTLFFLSELVTEVFGLRQWALPWYWREILQLMASLGLLLGTVAAALLLRQSATRNRTVERQLRAASGAFFDTMDECFAEWGLSPSERDVALFAVRGCSNAEIAELRGKSEATIKSQMNAIFRKANVSSRSQLVSQFIEVLIAEGGAEFATRKMQSMVAA